jgi:subtilase family serine protease
VNRLIIAAGAGILLLVGGCGSQGTEMASGITARPAAVTASADAFVRLVRGSVDLGPVSNSLPVSLLLMLRDPSAAQQAAQVAASYDPKSPQFGKFETVQQIKQSGPAHADVQRVQAALRRLGLWTRWSPGDAWLSVGGTASQVERAFGVSIRMYRRADGQKFAASLRDPAVPGILKPVVTGTSHIETYNYLLRPRDVPSGGMKPADILKAYDIKPLRSAGMNGAGQTVVFFEIDGFRQSDLNAYTKKFGLPAMKPVIKAGPNLAPQGEAEMDLEAVHAVAPAAKLVVYTLNQNQLSKQAKSDAQFLDTLVNFQRKIVNENPGAIVSNSVGSCANVLGKGTATTLGSVYARADALGEAWFAASGDQGAYDCLQSLEQPGDPPSNRDIGVDLPSSAPGVTGVGGTRLSVRTDSSWYAEQAWQGPAEVAGSGGGVSTYFSRPTWQSAKGVGNTAFDRSKAREVPDVSAMADPSTSGTYNIAGSFTQEGGTSQAAPIWAAIAALTNQYIAKHGGKKLGFYNPALYALARAPRPYAPFHDVTLGNNLKYPATAGYDMASGLGTPDAWNLARDLLAYSRGAGR